MPDAESGTITILQVITCVAGLMFLFMAYISFWLRVGEGVYYMSYHAAAYTAVNRAFMSAQPPLSAETVQNYIDQQPLDLCRERELRAQEQGDAPKCLVAKFTTARCPFWWIPRKCGVIRTTSEIRANAHTWRLIEAVARQPCRWLSNPTDRRDAANAIDDLQVRISAVAILHPILQQTGQRRANWSVAECAASPESQSFDVTVEILEAVPPYRLVATQTFVRPWWALLAGFFIELIEPGWFVGW